MYVRWEQILDGLWQAAMRSSSNWTVSDDSTVARTYQHVAGARRAVAADDLGGSGE